MAEVGGDDHVDPPALGLSHDDGIHETELERRILLEQLTRAAQIATQVFVHGKHSIMNVLGKCERHAVAQSRACEIVHFRQNGPGDYPGGAMPLVKLAYGGVVNITAIQQRSRQLLARNPNLIRDFNAYEGGSGHADPRRLPQRPREPGRAFPTR
jgi:hypothetical protein